MPVVSHPISSKTPAANVHVFVPTRFIGWATYKPGPQGGLGVWITAGGRAVPANPYDLWRASRRHGDPPAPRA
jgi:hypothetical protein